MDGQITFDEWFASERAGLSFEARRIMQIAWNAALTNGDQHFFVAELASALGSQSTKNATWAELIEAVRSSQDNAQKPNTD
jgi:hypothetical protein